MNKFEIVRAALSNTQFTLDRMRNYSVACQDRKANDPFSKRPDLLANVLDYLGMISLVQMNLVPTNTPSFDSPRVFSTEKLIPGEVMSRQHAIATGQEISSSQVEIDANFPWLVLGVVYGLWKINPAASGSK